MHTEEPSGRVTFAVRKTQWRQGDRACASQDGGLASLERATRCLRVGCGVVLTAGPEHGCSRAAILVAAEHVTPGHVNFMARFGRGIVSVALPRERCEALQLAPMARVPTNPRREMAASRISVEARYGISTGISASDRAHTISILASRAATPRDLVSPGHIFPLQTQDAGVCGSPGLPEAAVDLLRTAGVAPVAAICDVLDDSGDVPQMEWLRKSFERDGMPLVSVADVVWRRLRVENRLQRVRTQFVSTDSGPAQLVEFTESLTGRRHLAKTLGAITSACRVPVLVGPPCRPGDLVATHADLEDRLSRAGECGIGICELVTDEAASGQDRLPADPAIVDKVLRAFHVSSDAHACHADPAGSAAAEETAPQLAHCLG